MDLNNNEQSLERENEIETGQTEIVRFELDDIMRHFEESTDKIVKTSPIANDHWISGDKDVANFMRRAQIVALASAFDFYMHELTRTGLCEMYDGKWEKTEKFKSLPLSMENLMDAFEDRGSDEWFLRNINDKGKYSSMIAYTKVREQFNLLGIDANRVAVEAFCFDDEDAGKTTEELVEKLKNRLDALNKRRNLIVHQTDRDSRNAVERGITKKFVDDLVSDTISIVKAIDAVSREKGGEHSFGPDAGDDRQN